MRRKLYKLIIVSIAILILLIAMIFLFVKKDNNTQPTLGVWWWDDKLDVSYLNFAKSHGVTEIYYCSSEFNQKTENFIRDAHQKGIKVYWLAGEYQWIEDYDSLKINIENYLMYQKNYTYVFSGIHLDIEPHQHPDFKTNRQHIIKKYVELCYSLHMEYPTLYVEYDLPFWLDDEVEINCVSKLAYQHIIDVSSKVTLMSYRDTCEEIYSVSEDEIKYALSVGKTLNLGVETKSKEGDNVSFMEEGKRVMMQEIKKLRALIPSDFGVVIHQIYTWFNLVD